MDIKIFKTRYKKHFRKTDEVKNNFIKNEESSFWIKVSTRKV